MFQDSEAVTQVCPVYRVSKVFKVHTVVEMGDAEEGDAEKVVEGHRGAQGQGVGKWNEVNIFSNVKSC